MGWRFRKSFSPIPGVRLTVSPRGLSTSIGAGPMRFTVGPQGPAVTARIPGSGIAFRKTLRPNTQASAGRDPTPQYVRPPLEETREPTLAEIRSASTTALTSEGLESVKDVLRQAQEERDKLLPELERARSQASIARERFRKWEHGWLLRRVFKSQFARRAAEAELAAEKEAELFEQEQLSRMAIEFDLTAEVRNLFGQLCDSASFLGSSERIWDTVAHRATDRVRERTNAARAIDRKPVTIDLSGCDLIQTSWRVPRLGNANGGEILFYPGFVLYRVTNEAYALLDLRDVDIAYTPVAFVEEDTVPADSQVIEHTWTKVNKDGSRDRRFVDNYQIPVVAYARLK